VINKLHLFCEECTLIPKCSECKLLESKEFHGGLVGRVENIAYRCSAGRFDNVELPGGALASQYYSWGGIVKPNKTVIAAQFTCNEFQSGGRPRG
jgi:hypothetical protein